MFVPPVVLLLYYKDQQCNEKSSCQIALIECNRYQFAANEVIIAESQCQYQELMLRS